MSKDPQMEKNYWIALVLSMAVLMAYPLLLKKTAPAKPAVEEPAAAATGAEKDTILENVAQVAENIGATIEKKLAPDTVSFRNSQYDIKFSTLGGTIVEMAYKGEKSKVQTDVPFFFESPLEGNFATKILNQETDLSKTIFRLEKTNEHTFDFIYEKANEYRLTKRYTVEETRPAIQLGLRLENLSPHEKHFPLELTYGFYYADSHTPHLMDVESVRYQEKVKSAKLNKIQKKGFYTAEPTEWTGLLKKYFAILVKPDWKIISDENRADDKVLWSTLRMEPLSVSAGGKVEKQIFIYAGPQRYETLKNLKMDFELILSRGFFGLFKIWLLIGLKFFNQFTHNFGLAIILLTIALKILFAPLTHMSYESMRKMQAVQPKMKAIQERHKSDPAKMNREVMELYRRNKVNPMGGCLPMLAQIPIFIAFYQVLNETIELKGAPFIYWINDLAQPDRLFTFPFTMPVLGNVFHLLPLLMAVSMWWQQKVTPQASASKEQAQVMQLMPIMMGAMLYSMPSGLALYWFVNNMLTVVHQLVIKRMGDVILHHEDRD